MTEMFVRLSRNYTQHGYDYEAPVTEKLTDLASVVSQNATHLAERLSGAQLGGSKETQQEVPPSFSHAYAKVAFQSSGLISQDEPLGSALKKFATTQERIGNFRIQQDSDAVLKFYNPMVKCLDGRIVEAMVHSIHVESTKTCPILPVDV
jgi:hypothetical protein